MLRRQHVVGLDIGTTKVCAVVGEADEDGEVHIAGVGSTPSSGMRKGVVIDIDATTRAIEDAVERAERMAGMTISALYVGVSGEHITSTNSRGVIAVSRGDHEISAADVDRVVEAARMAALPASDREIVHMLPRGFVVDRKSTRLNSSHLVISYAVFCLKKKKNNSTPRVDSLAGQTSL